MVGLIGLISKAVSTELLGSMAREIQVKNADYKLEYLKDNIGIGVVHLHNTHYASLTKINGLRILVEGMVIFPSEDKTSCLHISIVLSRYLKNQDTILGIQHFTNSVCFV